MASLNIDARDNSGPSWRVSRAKALIQAAALIFSIRVVQGQYVISQQQINFSFHYPLVSSVMTGQSLMVLGPSGQVTASSTVNNGGYQWLSVTPGPVAMVNGLAELKVTVNPIEMTPSPVTIYTGRVIVNIQGSPITWTIPVTVSFAQNTIRDFTGNGNSGAILYNPISGQEYTAISYGDGTFCYTSNLFTPGFDTLRTGDFNGDGRADLVLYNSHTGLGYIGMGKGDGTFAFKSLFWSRGYDFVEAGDLNNDGMTDFALYNSSTGTLYTAISNGDGTFHYLYTLISKGYTFVRLAHVGLVTPQAGEFGIFLYNANTGQVDFGLSDNKGGFGFGGDAISLGYDLIALRDGNVPAASQSYEKPMLYNSANGNSATAMVIDAVFVFTPLLYSPGFTAAKLADFTGNGPVDSILYNKDSGLAYFGMGSNGNGNGVGEFTFQSLFWSPGYDNVASEDINGDGKMDVILYNSTTGTEYTGISNGDGTFTYTYQYWGTGRLLAR